MIILSVFVDETRRSSGNDMCILVFASEGHML